jgi:hypothetical protein
MEETLIERRVFVMSATKPIEGAAHGWMVPDISCL